MNNKRNKSGFTLVEVIVVMTMMGILLGAILNLVKPVNQAFQNAKAVTDTNQVGSGLNRYIETELRFSTNVLMLSDYEGVPQVSSTGVVGGASGTGVSKISFTDCLIIDNFQVRGSQKEDYDPTSTVARKMGCTGTIIHVGKLSSEGLNLKNSSIAMGEDYYGNQRYQFLLAMGTINNMSNVSLRTRGFQYSIRNGQYVFDDKRRFESGRSFDLVNINNDPYDNFKAISYVCSDPSIYTAFPKASAASYSGTAPGLSALYDGSHSYTYIFYTKSAETVNCTLTFNKRKPTDTADKLETKVVKMGGKISYSQVPKLQNADTTLYGIPYYRCTSADDTTLINREFKTEDDWKNLTITSDMTFEAVYEPLMTVTKYKVKFVNVDGSDPWFTVGGYMEVNGYPYTSNCNYLPNEFTEGQSGYNAGGIADKNTFIDWVDTSTGKTLGETEITSDGFVFKPKYVAKPKITYKIDDDVFKEVYVDMNATPESPKSDELAAAGKIPSDKVFAGWNTKKDGSGSGVAAATGDATYYAIFKNDTSSSDVTLSGETAGSNHSAWAGYDSALNKNYYVGENKINLQVQKQYGKKCAGVVKVKITYNVQIDDSSKYTVAPSGGAKQTISGYSVIIEWNSDEFNTIDYKGFGISCSVRGTTNHYEENEAAQEIKITDCELLFS